LNATFGSASAARIAVSLRREAAGANRRDGAGLRDGGPDPVGSPGRFAALRALRSTALPGGKNTAIVGHGYPYYSLIRKGQMLEEGEAAIVRPHGTSFEEVARLGLKEWRELGRLSR